MSTPGPHKPSLRELEERGIKGNKGPRDAKSVLRATREARRLKKRHEAQVEAAKARQTTDSNNK